MLGHQIFPTGRCDHQSSRVDSFPVFGRFSVSVGQKIWAQKNAKIWVSTQNRVSQNIWVYFMENHIEIHDLGGPPLFLETPISHQHCFGPVFSSSMSCSRFLSREKFFEMLSWEKRTLPSLALKLRSKCWNLNDRCRVRSSIQGPTEYCQELEVQQPYPKKKINPLGWSWIQRWTGSGSTLLLAGERWPPWNLNNWPRHRTEASGSLSGSNALIVRDRFLSSAFAGIVGLILDFVFLWCNVALTNKYIPED